MKELYEYPEIKVLIFGNEDVIATSEEATGDEGIELPDLPVKP